MTLDIPTATRALIYLEKPKILVHRDKHIAATCNIQLLETPRVQQAEPQTKQPKEAPIGSLQSQSLETQRHAQLYPQKPAAAINRTRTCS